VKCLDDATANHKEATAATSKHNQSHLEYCSDHLYTLAANGLVKGQMKIKPVDINQKSADCLNNPRVASCGFYP
jgi:hypothetical protein